MEGSSEVNGDEIIGRSVDSPHSKRKEDNEQIPQQVETGNMLENVAQIIDPGSLDNFMEVLGGKSENFGQGLTSDPTVEELTVDNYKSPSLIRVEGPSIGKGMWSNLTRFAGGPGGLLSVGEREHADKLFMPPFSNYSKVADHLAESDDRIASRSVLNRLAEGIQTKVVSASGFADFLVKNSLRGKGIAVRHQGINEEHLRVIKNQNINGRLNNDVGLDTNSSDRPDGKVDEISLREWLKTRPFKLDKVERLNMFTQILKIVNTSHSQGLVFEHLQPSFLMISPSNQVRYVGSFVSKNQMDQVLVPINPEKESNNFLDYHLKRKRHLEPGNGSFSPKHRKLGQSFKSFRMPDRVVSRSGCMQSTSEFLKLEENGMLVQRN